MKAVYQVAAVFFVCTLSVIAWSAVADTGYGQNGCLSAVDERRSNDALERRDGVALLNILRSCALRGDELSQFKMKMMLSTGMLPKEYQVAYWTERLAEAGDKYSQDELGRRYMDGGNGLARDYEKAAYWLEKAVSHGSRMSMVTLGELYLNGIGVERDYAKALTLFHSAQDDFRGLYNLGRMYRDGYGVRRDNVLAYVYFSLSSKYSSRRYGDIEDMDIKQEAVAWRELLARSMTREQVSEAEALIESWQPGEFPTGSKTGVDSYYKNSEPTIVRKRKP